MHLGTLVTKKLRFIKYLLRCSKISIQACILLLLLEHKEKCCKSSEFGLNHLTGGAGMLHFSEGS